MTTEKELGRGRFLRLIHKNGWEYSERIIGTGVVVLIPLVEDRLVLVEQFRPAVGRPVIELPAGLVGDEAQHKSEEMLSAAKRELLEETGYEAQDWQRILAGPPSSGLCSEIVTFFLATGLRKMASGGGNESESIQVHEVKIQEALCWLQEKERSGIWVDPKVFAGLYFGCRKLNA